MTTRDQRKLAQELIDRMVVVAIDAMLRAEKEDTVIGDSAYALGRQDMAKEMIDLIKRQASYFNLRQDGWYRDLKLVVDNTK